MQVSSEKHFIRCSTPQFERFPVTSGPPGYRRYWSWCCHKWAPRGHWQPYFHRGYQRSELRSNLVRWVKIVHDDCFSGNRQYHWNRWQRRGVKTKKIELFEYKTQGSIGPSWNWQLRGGILRVLNNISYNLSHSYKIFSKTGFSTKVPTANRKLWILGIDSKLEAYPAKFTWTGLIDPSE